MTPQDPVRVFLQERGCPETVVRRGLRGLVERWEQTVQEIRSGYRLGIDDYLNDMDGRQLIEEILQTAPAAGTPSLIRRVRDADAMLRPLLQPARECLWGAEAAAQHGWTADRQWWYFHQPKSPGTELADELPSSS